MVTHFSNLKKSKHECATWDNFSSEILIPVFDYFQVATKWLEGHCYVTATSKTSLQVSFKVILIHHRYQRNWISNLTIITENPSKFINQKVSKTYFVWHSFLSRRKAEEHSFITILDCNELMHLGFWYSELNESWEARGYLQSAVVEYQLYLHILKN